MKRVFRNIDEYEAKVDKCNIHDDVILLEEGQLITEGTTIGSNGEGGGSALDLLVYDAGADKTDNQRMYFTQDINTFRYKNKVSKRNIEGKKVVIAGVPVETRYHQIESHYYENITGKRFISTVIFRIKRYILGNTWSMPYNDNELTLPKNNRINYEYVVYGIRPCDVEGEGFLDGKKGDLFYIGRYNDDIASDGYGIPYVPKYIKHLFDGSNSYTINETNNVVRRAVNTLKKKKIEDVTPVFATTLRCTVCAGESALICPTTYFNSPMTFVYPDRLETLKNNQYNLFLDDMPCFLVEVFTKINQNDNNPRVNLSIPRAVFEEYMTHRNMDDGGDASNFIFIKSNGSFFHERMHGPQYTKNHKGGLFALSLDCFHEAGDSWDFDPELLSKLEEDCRGDWSRIKYQTFFPVSNSAHVGTVVVNDGKYMSVVNDGIFDVCERLTSPLRTVKRTVADEFVRVQKDKKYVNPYTNESYIIPEENSKHLAYFRGTYDGNTYKYTEALNSHAQGQLPNKVNKDMFNSVPSMILLQWLAKPENFVAYHYDYSHRSYRWKRYFWNKKGNPKSTKVIHNSAFFEDGHKAIMRPPHNENWNPIRESVRYSSTEEYTPLNQLMFYHHDRYNPFVKEHLIAFDLLKSYIFDIYFRMKPLYKYNNDGTKEKIEGSKDFRTVCTKLGMFDPTNGYYKHYVDFVIFPTVSDSRKKYQYVKRCPEGVGFKVRLTFGISDDKNDILPKTLEDLYNVIKQCVDGDITYTQLLDRISYAKILGTVTYDRNGSNW